MFVKKKTENKGRQTGSKEKYTTVLCLCSLIPISLTAHVLIPTTGGVCTQSGQIHSSNREMWSVMGTPSGRIT